MVVLYIKVPYKTLLWKHHHFGFRNCIKLACKIFALHFPQEIIPQMFGFCPSSSALGWQKELSCTSPPPISPLALPSVFFFQFFWILKKGEFLLNKKKITLGKKKKIYTKISWHSKKIFCQKNHWAALFKWRFCILDVLFTHTIVALLMMAQVWTSHPTKFFLPKSFNWISNDIKTYSKMNILCTLFSKSPLLNPTHWELSNDIQSAPKFPYNI
jgi:hypothetical protein